MRIGIDLDNTINDSANSSMFFSMLTHSFRDKAEIYIITNRDPDSREGIKQELDRLNIYYDYLYITAEKSKLIIKEDITIYFDDTDENFLDLPERVTVFKIREPGNFDFDCNKWIYGERTGYKI